MSAGVGISSYYGDLIQGSPLFQQPSFAASIGVTRHLTPHWALRADMSLLQVKASDSKNSRDDLKARNLSFKSNIFDFSVAGEYDLYDLNSGEKSFTPYAFLGVGFYHYNPFTTDRNGNKVYLRTKHTEGQATTLYPERKEYNSTQLQLPIGLGFKYALNENIVLALEFNYRYIGNDYLDDVSKASYPDQAFSAPGLTYRGDELPGGAPYPPKGTGLNRGNPNNTDSYYSMQAKFIWRFKGSGVQINY
jgi:opacity protein-like surface antigen